MRLLGLVVLAVWCAPTGAGAADPLQHFPAERLRTLAPLLVSGEMAAIEAGGDGRARQITLIAWAAAPPAMVHEVVGHPERYPEFVRNMSHSEVAPQPDGSVINTWQIELPIGHFNGAFNVRAIGSEPDGPIAFHSVSRENYSSWEFLPAEGGGTVIVEYMHYQAPRNNILLSRMLDKDPANETGMGLAAGLVLVKSVATESARRAKQAHLAVAAPPRSQPTFSFLLERGSVAITRSTPGGRLLDVSVVARIPAPIARVLEVVRDMDRWPEFMPAVKRCKVLSRSASEQVYEMTIDGTLLSMDTRYRMHMLPSGVDSLGVGGDLEGSRLRWDLTAQGDHTLAVYRANHKIGASSVILRALINYEPLFEHGVNVGVGIIAVNAVARRAMQPVGRVP